MKRKIFINSNYGFTLIEILVTISIISLISSVVLGALRSANEKAVNVTSNEIANQYFQAISRYYIDNGNFYVTGSLNEFCLSDYSDNKCGFNSIVSENQGLLDSLRPYYDLPGMPIIKIPLLGNSIYRGPIYAYCPPETCPLQTVVISWYVYSSNPNCGIGGAGLAFLNVRSCNIFFNANGEHYSSY